MKHKTIVVTGILLALLVSCGRDNTDNIQSGTVPDSGMPAAGKDSGESASVKADEYSDTLDKEPVPKVPLDPGQFIVTIIQTNLDLDTEDEQILVHKVSKGEDSPIIVDIVDFDTIRNKYVISWEYETKATNVRSFNLSLEDVTGDHNLEIVCTGSYGNDKQTIDILKRSSGMSRYGLLAYKPILSLMENGNIEIQQEQRSQGYKTGISNGKSFPVITTANSGGDGKRFDIVKKTYYWRNDEDRYSLINTEVIPGKKIEDSRLRKLLTGSKSAFERYLSSMWILSAAQKADSGTGPLVLFDLDGRKITFYDNNIQEIYRWESSTKTLYNTLIINCRNDIVPYLRITLYIRIIDMNTIRLVYKDDSMRNTKKATNKSWSGKYIKTDKALEDYLFTQTIPDKDLPDSANLSGYYQSDTGGEIYFDPPRFELKKDGKTYHGAVYLYSIGTDILQLKFINDEQEVTGIKTYKYDFLVNKTDTEIVRTLVLIPGKINVTGFIPTVESFIRYEQIEQLDPDN